MLFKYLINLLEKSDSVGIELMLIKAELFDYSNHSCHMFIQAHALLRSSFIYIQFHRDLTRGQIITVILTQFHQTFINLKKNWENLQHIKWLFTSQSLSLYEFASFLLFSFLLRHHHDHFIISVFCSSFRFFCVNSLLIFLFSFFSFV